MKAKSYTTPYHLLLLSILSVVIVMWPLSCADKKKDTDDTAEKRDERFSAALSSGDYVSADSLITVMRAVARERRDSDLWCESKVHESVLGYYLCDPKRMLSAIDSADRWLGSRSETPRRLYLRQKIYQTKGALYTQFYYNPDSAIRYQYEAAVLAERSGNKKEYVLALANTADAYKTNSQLDLASDYYMRAIQAADTAGFTPADYISLYGGLATVYTGLRDFDKSAVWWKKTLDLWPLMSPYEKFNNLNNYGTDYYYRRDYRGALKVFKQLQTFLDSLPAAEWEKNFAAINLSDCFLKLGMPDSVNSMLPAAAEYFTSVQPNPVALSYLHTLMMRRAWLKGNKAEVDALISHHPYSDTLRPEMRLLRLEFLSDYYADAGKHSMALGALRKFETLDDSLRSVAVKQSIAARGLEYERDRDVLTLKAANAEQESSIVSLLAVIAVVLVILLLVVSAHVIIRRRTALREQKMLDKISALHTESLRSRITPHFIYNALNHEIRNRNAGLPSRLESIVSLLRQQQFVASELVTTLEKELEFTEAYIHIQGDNYEGRLSYELSISDGLRPEELRMPSMFLQILAENAFKHAFPSIPASETCVIRIRVERGEDYVTVSVFNSAAGVDDCCLQHGGTGLRIIMETIQMLKERQQIEIKFSLNLKYTISDSGSTGCLATYTIPYQWMKISK